MAVPSKDSAQVTRLRAAYDISTILISAVLVGFSITYLDKRMAACSVLFIFFIQGAVNGTRHLMRSEFYRLENKLWFDNLSNRFALKDIAKSIQNQDWIKDNVFEEASKKAIDDINLFRSSEKVTPEPPGLFFGFFEVWVGFAIQAAIGLGIALTLGWRG